MKIKLGFLSWLVFMSFLLSNSVVCVAWGGEKVSVEVRTDKICYMAGDETEITLKIATNYNALAMRWFVLYSKDVFQVNESNLNFRVTDEFEMYDGNSSCSTSDNLPYPEGYSSQKYGIVLVQWLGGGQNISTFNCPEGLDCFKFNLKVRDDAENLLTGDVFIPANSAYYNVALEDANDASTYYKASDLICTFTGSQVVVTVDQEPALIAREGTDAVVDEENGIIYGLTGGLNSYEDIHDFVCAVGEGAEIDFVPSDFGTGTGSVVNLKKNGEILKSYTVVFFADANGDCVVDESDIVLIDLYNSMILMPQENTPEFLAMDCTRDSVVDESDFFIVDMVICLLGEIDQVNGGIVLY